VSTEKENALRIETFLCNLRRLRVKHKLLKLYYSSLGFSQSLSKLPRELKLLIASYLSQKDLLTKLNGTSCEMRQIS